MEITLNPVAYRERHSNQDCSGHLTWTGDEFQWARHTGQP
jgi:hypothetical protein